MGVTLVGPSVTFIVPAISDEEYITAVRQHMLDWPDSAEGLTQGSQSFAILTMCRGLRTWRTGEYVSKREAARWAAEMLPEHAQVIHDALLWRQRSHEQPPIDGAATREATEIFVAEVKRQLEREGISGSGDSAT